MSVSEQNNNISDDYCCTFNVESIRSQCHEAKLNFIKNVLKECATPANFESTWKTNSTKKIFFRIKDGCEEKREWLLFDNNHFYCAYCVCFASKENQFVKGVEYVKGGRITDNLNKHEKQEQHQRAMGTYAELNANCRLKSCQGVPRTATAKRIVLRSILKIIIFLATHGKYLYIS